MDIETKRVNSKAYNLNRLLFTISVCFFLLFMFLIGGRYKGFIEREKISWFFKDWQTFKTWASYFFWISTAFSAFFGLKFDHNLGSFKLNEARLFADRIIFHFDKMKHVKFSVNSPRVFGRRNVREGYKNFVEFFMDGEKKRYEFYIENQAM